MAEDGPPVPDASKKPGARLATSPRRATSGSERLRKRRKSRDDGAKTGGASASLKKG